MNIEELSSCFDSVTPTKEQRDRIFAGVMNVKNQPVKVIKFHRYATAVAAVFVIGVFAVAYPQISRNTLPAEVDKPTVAMEYHTDKIGEIEKSQPETYSVSEVKNEADIQNTSLTDKIKATYPDAVDKKTEALKEAAVGEEIKVAVNDSAEDSLKLRTIEEPVEETDSNIATASFGGGGGAASFDSASYESLTYSQLVSHPVYSELIPAYLPDGYMFIAANEYKDGSAEVYFENTEGRQIYINPVPEELYNPENVINPEEIKGFDNRDYIGFAVKNDKYYVYYSIDECTSEDIYKMVISSAFYNN